MSPHPSISLYSSCKSRVYASDKPQFEEWITRMIMRSTRPWGEGHRRAGGHQAGGSSTRSFIYPLIRPLIHLSARLSAYPLIRPVHEVRLRHTCGGVCIRSDVGCVPAHYVNVVCIRCRRWLCTSTLCKCGVYTVQTLVVYQHTM